MLRLCAEPKLNKVEKRSFKIPHYLLFPFASCLTGHELSKGQQQRLQRWAAGSARWQHAFAPLGTAPSLLFSLGAPLALRAVRLQLPVHAAWPFSPCPGWFCSTAFPAPLHGPCMQGSLPYFGRFGDTKAVEHGQEQSMSPDEIHLWISVATLLPVCQALFSAWLGGRALT